MSTANDTNKCRLCGYVPHTDKMLADQCRLMTAILGEGWGDRVGRTMARRWGDRWEQEKRGEKEINFALSEYLEEANALKFKEGKVGELNESDEEGKMFNVGDDKDFNENEFTTLKEMIENQTIKMNVQGEEVDENGNTMVEQLNTSSRDDEEEVFVTPFTSFEIDESEELFNDDQRQQGKKVNRKAWWLVKLMEKFR